MVIPKFAMRAKLAALSDSASRRVSTISLTKRMLADSPFCPVTLTPFGNTSVFFMELATVGNKLIRRGVENL